jgi:hypothetical protein
MLIRGFSFVPSRHGSSGRTSISMRDIPPRALIVYAPGMRLYVFRSGRESDVFGYTADPSGVNLPGALGPWMRSGQSPLDIEPEAHAARLGVSEPVVAAVERDGFYIARSETIERMTGVPSVE